MRSRVCIIAIASSVAVATSAFTTIRSNDVDWATVARIREEGLQRSQVMELESYIADVLGARLTMSTDMQRAQTWLRAELTRMGLANVAAEPYMDYGVTWDNEYVSLHLVEPDYQPMLGYPIAHTAGTNGRQVVDAMIVDLQSRADLAKYRGKLRGKAVLVTPPPVVDLAPLTNGVPRYTAEQLAALERVTIVPARPAPARVIRNPDVLTAVEKVAFYAAEGVAAVLQSESGWLLHAGDAYFSHGEVHGPTRQATLGLDLFQRLMQVDGQARLANQDRLRQLARDAAPAVRIICSHDPGEFEACRSDAAIAHTAR